jgi:HEAT repeat protein
VAFQHAAVLPGTGALGARLRDTTVSTDPSVRDVAVDLLRVTGLGTTPDFRAAAADPETAVRLQAVRGLVRLDDVAGLAAVAGDPVREVRVAVAHGLGTVGDPGGAAAIGQLVGDVDPLVRAVALQAAGLLGCPGELVGAALGALADPAWQVREGAAKALGAAPADIAVPALAGALHDVNLDVRRAAVRALASWTDRDDVRELLRLAADDPDADVRAYARRAVPAGV